jgi:toxin ParE1/3/4
VRLEWSNAAIGDREEIFDYIAFDNPPAAIKLDERISERVQALLQFPESGRLGRVPGTRELIVSGTAYIANQHNVNIAAQKKKARTSQSGPSCLQCSLLGETLPL